MHNHTATVSSAPRLRSTSAGQFRNAQTAQAEAVVEAIASCMTTRDLLATCECEIHRDILALLRTERAIHVRIERIDTVVLPEVQRCYNGA